MKIKKIIIILILLLNIISGINIKQVQAANSNQTKQNSAPTIQSQGAVLLESSSGKILYGKNQDEKLYPASTTKILTAILAIENCKPTDKITASYDAVMSIPAGYSNAAIQPGETLKFQDLLDMFLIHSANEIGNIFAEHISGNIKDFANLMNQKAIEIGCKNTHFTNPSGIHDKDHYSTPYDMALIAQYCMKNETFRNIVSKTSCTIEPTDKYEKRFFKNTNDLLNSSSKYYYKYAIGVKTGYTSQAKRCLISASVKDNLELIAVILGAESTVGDDIRYQDTINLFEYGYSNYKISSIATKNTVVKEIIVENATKDTEKLSLLIKEDINGIVPANLNNFDYIIKLNDTISAPIQQGTILGKIIYNIDGFDYSSDLIANSSVEKYDPLKTLVQIALVLFILFVLLKLFFPKRKSKKCSKYKNKHKSKNINRIKNQNRKFN